VAQLPSREAFVSVTVGFSQATTSLIVPAPAATKLEGAVLEGAAESSGGLGLFAALLAMLTPGTKPTAETDTATATVDAPIAAAVGSTILPATSVFVDPAVETPVPPEFADLQKSEEGKALLKDFADALKAAKAALDAGEPLDPALEKKLADTVDAIAAWFAGQPQLQPLPVDASKISDLAGGSNILPAAPSGDLPDPTVPTDAGSESPTNSPQAATPADDAATGTVVEKTMLLQIVPARLAELGDALKTFAAELQKTAPELAKSLSNLADRIDVGDIADDAFKQLGLDRSVGSTSPELDQLVAALTVKPGTKTTTATPVSPIAAPVLDLPEGLAASSQVANTASETRKTELPELPATQPAAKSDAASEVDAPTQPALLVRSTDAKLDADVQLEPTAVNPDDRPATTDSKPASPAPQTNAKAADIPAPAAAPIVTNADVAAQGAQAAAATAAASTRAIHAAYAAPVQQLNIPQVAFEVARQFGAGNTKFQIRLDPADLGRIDVKLDLDKSGTVNAHMFVERPETLDLMMRDQRALQQALQQAGLDQSKTSLEFSLRQNPFAGAGGDTGQGGGNGQPGFGPYGTPLADESAELAAQTIYRGSASASGVNLFV